MDENISKSVIRCAFEVSNELGAGYLENVYENALCLELDRAGVNYDRQQKIRVKYKGWLVGDYVADLIIERCLLVELKAVSRLNSAHEAQLMNYLRATGLSVGLLLNFGTNRVGIKRIVWKHDDCAVI